MPTATECRENVAESSAEEWGFVVAGFQDL
jgi:hypothetical protein